MSRKEPEKFPLVSNNDIDENSQHYGVLATMVLYNLLTVTLEAGGLRAPPSADEGDEVSEVRQSAQGPTARELWSQMAG